MVDFPNLAPSDRSYETGDYPVKRYTSESGIEIRILRGSRWTGMPMNLQYKSIADTDADKFIEHYEQQRGTFDSFILVASDGGRETKAKAGWGGELRSIGAEFYGNKWRYAGPVTVTSIYPGVSNVTVRLLAVLRDD